MKSESYIKGNVVKILFENSTGYKVGLFKVVEGSSELESYVNKTITFTGNFMMLNNELTYKFYGMLVNHARYGMQFGVSAYESVMPSDEDGIVMYLSSGIFKGIGPKTAKEIVKTFGSEAIKEIKSGNPILSKIKGMNSKKANELTRKILEHDKDQEIIIEFNKMGFTTEECLKIVNKYQNRCFDIIENNIYLLSEDISFLKLDKVFLSFHDENERVRIDALIKFNIKSLCYQTGNTLVSKESLYLEVNKYFSQILDSKVFSISLEELIELGEVIESDGYITLSEFYEVEESISSAIKKLVSIKNDFNIKTIEKEIIKYEKDYDIKFNQEQKDAIIGSLVNNLFIITGGPGTGKTTIIKAIVQIYQSLVNNLLSSDIVLLAPTGRASKRISESTLRKASTIHKFLKWNKETKEFSVNKYNPVSVKAVIIDEFSMVDIFLFNSLLDGLPINVKLILVGDANQLPSIAPGNILDDLLSVEGIPNKKLETIYRTSNQSYIIPFANNIKTRTLLESVPNGYSDFKFILSEDMKIKYYVNDICIKAKEKGINIEDFQVLIPMYKGENGIDNINIMLQGIFNPKSEEKSEIIIRNIVYRVGDKVLQLVNDVENNIYNGDIGYIKRINNSMSIIEIDFNGNVVVYKKNKFDEFTHAYAISVHKSQGSEYDTVLLIVSSNMKRMLYNKLIYTAVTRAKKGLIVVGSLESVNYAIKESYSENRITSLRKFF